jgi:hypothetical protein
VRSLYQPAVLQPGEGLTQRHAADTHPLGQLALGGETAPRLERSALDAAGEFLLDLEVGGQASSGIDPLARTFRGRL